jgi:hypothetical protein
MILSPPVLGDFDKIRKLHEKYYKGEFDFPDISQNLMNRVVRDSRGIVGIGMIRPLYEVIMILNKDRGSMSRVRALSMLLNDIPVEQIHAFVQDERFAELLKNRFRFNSIKGIGLVR